MNIYVASSWRNRKQQDIVKELSYIGHNVYDFKNPPNGTEFAWSSIDCEWQDWAVDDYLFYMHHPTALDGFKSDYEAMAWADACVLVLPCGRSAHLELGWFAGQGKPTCILMLERSEPELMYFLADHIATSVNELIFWLHSTGEIQKQELPLEGKHKITGLTYIDKDGVLREGTPSPSEIQEGNPRPGERHR